MKRTNLSITITLFFGLFAQAAAADFSMQIRDTMRLSGQGIIMTGKIASGVIHNGDSLCVPLAQGGQVGREVKGMEKISKVVDTANAGDNIGILVADLKEDDIAVGQNLTDGCAD
jgi:elongation factor Tu